MVGLDFLRFQNKFLGMLLKIGNYDLADSTTWVFFKLKVFSNVRFESKLPWILEKNFTYNFKVVSAGITHLVSSFTKSYGTSSTNDWIYG